MQNTPRSERIHIGIFGRTNSGKSSLLNAVTGQQVSIVSYVAGTTTDPVNKSMEIHGIGAVTFMDTAGFDDGGVLGQERVGRTAQAADRTDVAVIIFGEGDISREKEWAERFRSRRVPVIAVLNKADLHNNGSLPDSGGLRNSDLSGSCNVLNESGLQRGKEVPGKGSLPDRGEPYKSLYNDRNLLEGGNLQSKGYPSDTLSAAAARVEEQTGLRPIIVSAKTGQGIPELIVAIAEVAHGGNPDSITGSLASQGDVVLLVMPQDAQAPKGRLILPQVQTIRDLLDKKCIAVSCTPDMMAEALGSLAAPPKLIITDSQVFPIVAALTPPESLLTSFSVLLARYKGDMKEFVKGAAAIDSLTEHSRVLIAEACTHAPLDEDIGREKIPRMLRAKVGQELQVDVVGGADFPEDLTVYDLIIHCGACMFNRRHVLSRIARAQEQGVPITNYGVAIAYLTSVLDKVVWPE